MILDDHQVSDTKSGIHPPGGIGQQQRLHPQKFEHPDRINDLLRRIAFIIMESAGQDRHLHTADLSEDQLPLVPLDRGHGKMRNSAIGDLFFDGYLAGKIP
jgi:hypothetical protein